MCSCPWQGSWKQVIVGYGVIIVTVVKASAHQKALWERTATGWRVGNPLRGESEGRVSE